MDVCKLTQSKFTDLERVIKRNLRKNNMLRRQASDSVSDNRQIKEVGNEKVEKRLTQLWIK